MASGQKEASAKEGFDQGRFVHGMGFGSRK
jgi:hypothetical protein